MAHPALTLLALSSCQNDEISSWKKRSVRNTRIDDESDDETETGSDHNTSEDGSEESTATKSEDSSKTSDDNYGESVCADSSDLLVDTKESSQRAFDKRNRQQHLRRQNSLLEQVLAGKRKAAQHLHTAQTENSPYPSQFGNLNVFETLRSPKDKILLNEAVGEGVDIALRALDSR